MNAPTKIFADVASEQESADSLLRAVAHVPKLPLNGASLRGTSRLSGAGLPGPGTIIGGRYELGEQLGVGGMGAVYAARNLRTDKEVAIKLLLSVRAHGVERFVREARATARIRHPNVVDVYDVEPDGDTPYLVMERLHGHSLRSWMRQCVPEQEAVAVLLAALEGVCEAHRQGVIHRDLKPENVFLAREQHGNAQRVVKVLDFGLSRLLARDVDESEVQNITEVGSILGTPAYMPLEQLRGRTDEVDARADVHALGVILFEALSGVRPYRAIDNHELVVRMATEAPTPLRALAPGVDESLAAIVMRAIAVDAGDRYPTARAFADALDAWQRGQRNETPDRRVCLGQKASAHEEADGPVLLSIDGNHRAGTWGPVFMVVWRGEVDTRVAEDVQVRVRNFASSVPGGRVALLTVVEESAPLPSADARAALANILRVCAEHLHASAVVIKGAGFRAAAVRSVATGLALVARQPFPHRVFLTTLLGSEWLQERLVRSGLNVTSGGIASGMAALRAIQDGVDGRADGP